MKKERIILQGKTSRWHKTKWAIKKWWWTRVLGRKWEVSWKWYGGYGIVNKNWKFRLEDTSVASSDGAEDATNG